MRDLSEIARVTNLDSTEFFWRYVANTDAKYTVYVFTTIPEIQKAVHAASKAPGEDVFFKLAGSNTLSEANGVSLIAYLD